VTTSTEIQMRKKASF